MTKNEIAALVLGASLLSAPMAIAYESGNKCVADKCGTTKMKTVEAKEQNTTKAANTKCGAGKMKAADAKCGGVKK